MTRLFIVSNNAARVDDPTSSTMNMQHYLRLPHPQLSRPFTVLPQPNVVDKWISWNSADCLTNVLLPGILHISDVPNDQVLCTVQLNITLVRSSPNIAS